MMHPFFRWAIKVASSALIVIVVMFVLFMIYIDVRCQVKAAPTQVHLMLKGGKYENVIVRNDTRDTLTLSVLADQTRVRVSHMPSVMPWSWSPVTITCDSTQHESFSVPVLIRAGAWSLPVTVEAEGVSGVQESTSSGSIANTLGTRSGDARTLLSVPCASLFDLLGRPVKGVHARQQLFEWRQR